MLTLKAIEDIIAKCIQEVTKRHAQATTDVHQLAGAAEGIRFVAQELSQAHAAATGAVPGQDAGVLDVAATPSAASSESAPTPAAQAAAAQGLAPAPAPDA